MDNRVYVAYCHQCDRGEASRDSDIAERRGVAHVARELSKGIKNAHTIDLVEVRIEHKLAYSGLRKV